MIYSSQTQKEFSNITEGKILLSGSIVQKLQLTVTL